MLQCLWILRAREANALNITKAAIPGGLCWFYPLSEHFRNLPDQRYIAFLLKSSASAIIFYIEVVNAHILRYSIVITIPLLVAVSSVEYRNSPAVYYYELMEIVVSGARNRAEVVIRPIAIWRKRIRELYRTACARIKFLG